MEIGRVLTIPAARPRPPARPGARALVANASTPAQTAGARAPVERVVQGEVLQREGHSAPFLDSLRAAARAAARFGAGTDPTPGPQRGARAVAAYRANQGLFDGAPARTSVDAYA